MKREKQTEGARERITLEHVRAHFQTITRHRHMVRRYCFKLGLYWQGITHDLSKYSPTEFIPGCRYFQGNRSPNNREREVIGYSSAWLHHKGRNKHHYEYWTEGNIKTRRYDGVRMPAKYFAEMIADRIAACRIYAGDAYTDGHPLAYFERTQELMLIHPDTRAALEKVLTMLRDEGEERTLAWVKREIVKKNRY